MEGEVEEDSVKRFLDTYFLLRKENNLNDEVNFIDIFKTLEEKIFKKNQFDESLKILNRINKRFEKDEINNFIIKILKCFCHFQKKEFFEFREIWSKMNHKIINKIQNKNLKSLYGKFNNIWAVHYSNLNNFADFEKEIPKLIQKSDFSKIFNITQLFELIDKEKAIKLLFEIIKVDKEWENSKALKKSFEIINDLHDNKKKKEFRQTLKELIK